MEEWWGRDVELEQQRRVLERIGGLELEIDERGLPAGRYDRALDVEVRPRIVRLLYSNKLVGMNASFVKRSNHGRH